MKAILDQAIADIEALQSNLYGLRLLLNEVRDPGEWNARARAGFDSVRQFLDRVTEQIASVQAELDGILQQREASEKGLTVLNESMNELAAAIERIRGSLNLKEAA
jgi:hypothetical protein